MIFTTEEGGVNGWEERDLHDGLQNVSVGGSGSTKLVDRQISDKDLTPLPSSSSLINFLPSV